MKKILFQYIIPAAMVAGFLCFFFYDALHYITNADDSFNDEYVSKLGVVEAAKLFFSNINGRWFSHIVTAVAFHFLKHNVVYYAVYLTAMMLVFVASISIFHASYLRTFVRKEVTILTSISFAWVFTATIYFLLFVGREEIWAWVSSVNNHLLSVIVAVLLFSLLIKEGVSSGAIFRTLLVFLLAAAIGGLNEVNAVCTALSVGGLMAMQHFQYPTLKLSKLNMWLAIIVILASLATNILSGGYESRMNSLPSFTLMQSLKNTVHTFALPIMQYQYIVLRAWVLLTFIQYLAPPSPYGGKVVHVTPLLWRSWGRLFGILGIVVVSFFGHCFTLSDITPARGEVWAYTLLLLAVFALANRNAE
ncbi:MAG: hypothetical protein ACYDCN_06720 [Bacteroidia bacterium]